MDDHDPGLMAFDDAQEQIVRGAAFMHRGVGDARNRYQRAADAGATLAAEVYRYTEDPESVGLGALRDAYDAFMGQHAGNFASVASNQEKNRKED